MILRDERIGNQRPVLGDPRSLPQMARGETMTEPTPVTIRGTTYPSISAAARAFGITPQAVWDGLERGRADFIGLGRNWWHKEGTKA
jgi:hypothetical protein